MAHDASTASTINMQPEAIFTKKILCYLVIGYATFRPDRFGLVASVTGLFGLEAFRSDYDILQKSYMFTF